MLDNPFNVRSIARDGNFLFGPTFHTSVEIAWSNPSLFVILLFSPLFSSLSSLSQSTAYRYPSAPVSFPFPPLQGRLSPGHTNTGSETLAPRLPHPGSWCFDVSLSAPPTQRESFSPPCRLRMVLWVTCRIRRFLRMWSTQ